MIPTNTGGYDFVNSGELSHGLADDFKLPLHSSAKHGVTFIVRNVLPAVNSFSKSPRAGCRTGISGTQASYMGTLVSSTDCRKYGFLMAEPTMRSTGFPKSCSSASSRQNRCRHRPRKPSAETRPRSPGHFPAHGSHLTQPTRTDPTQYVETDAETLQIIGTIRDVWNHRVSSPTSNKPQVPRVRHCSRIQFR